jgi:hypothetical protein
MNADPNEIADLHACSGRDSRQNDQPSGMSIRDAGSDSKCQNGRDRRYQHHDFESLGEQRANEHADR